MSPRPGEVWLADIGMAAKKSPVIGFSLFVGVPKFQEQVVQFILNVPSNTVFQAAFSVCNFTILLLANLSVGSGHVPRK